MLPLLPPASVLINGDFRDGLKGWQVEGSARLSGGALSIGPGKGAIRQRLKMPGLRILNLSSPLISSSKAAEGGLRLQWFDARRRLVMDRKGGGKPEGGAGIYLKTQARTAYVVVSIEKTSATGAFLATGVRMEREDPAELPIDLPAEAGLSPIWEGDTVTDETVLLTGAGDAPRTGRLLFPVKRLLSVRDAARAKSYVEGRDFTLAGDLLAAKAGAAIPTMAEEEFKTGDLPWTETKGRHVLVTYTHDAPWTGPRPAPQGDRLPLTMAKLETGKPVRMVAFGDSITLGASPFTPPWPALLARDLRKTYKNPRVEMINTALGGMTTYWAVDNARDAVAALDPDLVFLAFGMNDFWSLTPDLFAANIRLTMQQIRDRVPKAEFVLVASMKFDPAYTSDGTYVGNLAGYAEELRRLAGPGVAFFDMAALSGWLYSVKGAKSLLVDPLHPNDFLARLYAQGLAATLTRP